MRSFVLALFVVTFTSGAFAQTRIPGRVIDAQQKPVAGIEVLLHAVTEQSGTQIDRDTSRADGSFELNVPSPDPNAVYFVAVVYNDQLFMGDMMRPPFPLEQEYIVQVGVNPIDLSAEAAGTAVTPQEAKKNRTAGIVVIIAALLVIAGIIAFALRRRPPARRRWLVELARIENDLAAGEGDRHALEKRRAQLRARLRAPRSD